MMKFILHRQDANDNEYGVNVMGVLHLELLVETNNALKDGALFLSPTNKYRSHDSSDSSEDDDDDSSKSVSSSEKGSDDEIVTKNFLNEVMRAESKVNDGKYIGHEKYGGIVAQFAANTARLNGLEEDRDMGQQVLKAHSSRMDDIEETNNCLKTDMSSTRSNVTNIETKVATVEFNVDAIDTRTKMHKASTDIKVDDLSNRVDSLSLRVDDVEARLNDLEIEKSSVNDQLEQFKDCLEEIPDPALHGTDDQIARDELISQLKADIGNLTNRIDQALKQIDGLKHEVTSSDRKTNALEQRVDKASKYAGDLFCKHYALLLLVLLLSIFSLCTHLLCIFLHYSLQRVPTNVLMN